MLVLSDVGADAFLKARFNNDWPVDKNLTMKLYTNNYTPLSSSVAGDFTEATGGGYVAKTLTNGSWTITPANDPSDAVHPAVPWTFTGALTADATIYGYFVVDGDGVLQWAELLSVPFQPANNGDMLTITPKFEMSHGTPAV